MTSSAWAFHAGNLVLYVVVAVEVWALARRLLGPRSAWVAAFGFAVYPRHSESVAWISGSTDLVAAAIGIPAVLCALAPWRPGRRALSAAALAAAAALAKESAFVLPFLAAICVWAARGPRRRWVAPIAMGAAQMVVLGVRTWAVGGLGGYSEYPWTPLRFVAGVVSYGTAALSPPQFELLRDPALLIVPVAALIFAAFAVRSLRRRGEHERLRLAVAGVGWFFVALLPSLNLVIDLNTGNGERLLFLPSVGLALAFAALFPLTSRATTAALVAAGAAALALSLLSAQTWQGAGELTRRVVAEAAALAPRNGELVAVTLPEEYRSAHVLPGITLAAALQQAGRGDVRVTPCIPVIVRAQRTGAIRLTPSGSSYLASTTWDAPFDRPVLRNPSPVSADCLWTASRRWPPGLALHAVAYPRPTRQPVVLAYFDGRDLVKVP